MTDNAGPQFSNPTNAGAPGAIRGDWRCIACEYRLVGLDPTGVCPECGTRIALSLRHDGLSNSNPLWMLRLSQATGLFFFCILTELLLNFAMYPPLNLKNVTILWELMDRIFVLVTAFVWLAIWQLATPEYLAGGRYRSTKMCWTIRIVATLSISHWALFPLLNTSRYLPICFSLLYMMTVALTWIYLRNLAKRIPDPNLVNQAPLVIACLLISDFIAHLQPRIDLAFGTHLPQVPPNVSSVCLIAALGFATYLSARFFNQFTACANQAMQNYLSERDIENRARGLADSER